MTKPEPKQKQTTKPTQRVNALQSALLDIDDEINELIEILNCLPELQIMTKAMLELIEPPSKYPDPTNTDRLSRCATETFNKSLDDYLSDSAQEFINLADTTGLSDMTEFVEMIPIVVQWRLYRVQALLSLARS